CTDPVDVTCRVAVPLRRRDAIRRLSRGPVHRMPRSRRREPQSDHFGRAGVDGDTILGCRLRADALRIDGVAAPVDDRLIDAVLYVRRRVGTAIETLEIAFVFGEEQ